MEHGAGVAVIWGPRVLGTPHPRITSELGVGVPIMPGGLGIPVGPKTLGIWGPHSDMGTPHTQKLDDDYEHSSSL